MSLETFLRQNPQRDLLRLTTAGSVDDGKSTLIGRLLYDSKAIYDDQLAALQQDSRKLNREEPDLALLTDGLRSEREQGITIDVAYRYFSTPRRRFIIADTPGHEQYTRNMATGASTANLAVILIDARRGVMTQSRRHGFIASLLGIPHVLVVINKMDLVDYAETVFEDIRAEYGDFAAKLSFRDLAFIPISALRGDNVVHPHARMPWYQGVPLLAHLETVHIASDRNLIDLRFPVQYVNRPTPDFRGYCGTVASGVVRVGEEVMALPSGKTSRVRSIVTFDGPLSYAFPPQSVTLCLEDELDIGRGDVLAHPGNLPQVASEVEAMLVWMSETPFKPGQPYLVKHLTRTVRAVFTRLIYRVDPNELHREAADALRLNEIGRVTVELFRPILCDEYARNHATGSFIVIDPVSHCTVGAGMIITRSRPITAKRLGSAVAGPVSLNITPESSRVGPGARAAVLRQQPVTLWLTGLSGSGKSTIALGVEERLVAAGHACYVLDGDNLRGGLNRDLGFSAKDRSENIRRVAEVARLFNDAGLIVLTSFISPYRADREAARQIIGPAVFVEAFVDAPLEVCEHRDPKGLYRKARAGKIEGFTGVSAPYEPPDCPDFILPTDSLSVDDAVARVIAELVRRGCIRNSSPSVPETGGRV
jgi:bifunctional enzyme CysN/CysC